MRLAKKCLLISGGKKKDLYQKCPTVANRSTKNEQKQFNTTVKTTVTIITIILIYSCGLVH